MESDPVKSVAKCQKSSILLIICIWFSCILLAINSLSRDYSDGYYSDDNLFGTGIAISIIQNLLTLIIIIYDISGKDVPKYTFLYNIIILLSSAYMIGFGILNLMKDDIESKSEIVNLSIVSAISGSIGILYLFSDIICSGICKLL